MRARFTHDDFYREKHWVIAALQEELTPKPDQLWDGEPSAAQVREQRKARVRFLRKHSCLGEAAPILADKLDTCCRRHPCLSGACPECGRLFQRAWVRKSRQSIAVWTIDDQELVAISLVLPKSAIGPGDLHTFDHDNMQRRLKCRLDAAGIDMAIGGIDFSFNEDEEGKFPSFWCPHAYVISATHDRLGLRRQLAGFDPNSEIPRPTRITPFHNNPRRRSYAMKMHFERRIGYDDERQKTNGEIRRFRNARRDRLRAAERLELFLLLDRMGFSARTIFKGIKPIIAKHRGAKGVKFRRITALEGNGERYRLGA